jgi:hypothetical protein
MGENNILQNLQGETGKKFCVNKSKDREGAISSGNENISRSKFEMISNVNLKSHEWLAMWYRIITQKCCSLLSDAAGLFPASSVASHELKHDHHFFFAVCFGFAF